MSGDWGVHTGFTARPVAGNDVEFNWPPAPDGPFHLVLRDYSPEPAAADGTWKGRH